MVGEADGLLNGEDPRDTTSCEFAHRVAQNGGRHLAPPEDGESDSCDMRWIRTNMNKYGQIEEFQD